MRRNLFSDGAQRIKDKGINRGVYRQTGSQNKKIGEDIKKNESNKFDFFINI